MASIMRVKLPDIPCLLWLGAPAARDAKERRETRRPFMVACSGVGRGLGRTKGVYTQAQHSTESNGLGELTPETGRGRVAVHVSPAMSLAFIPRPHGRPAEAAEANMHGSWQLQAIPACSRRDGAVIFTASTIRHGPGSRSDSIAGLKPSAATVVLDRMSDTQVERGPGPISPGRKKRASPT